MLRLNSAPEQNEAMVLGSSGSCSKDGVLLPIWGPKGDCVMPVS